jgi:FolB domain-containing protein
MEKMDKIKLNGLHALGIIGVYDHERKKPQEIIVDLVLFTNIHPVAKHDSLSADIDYAEIADEIRQICEHSQKFTLEALAEAIAAHCLEYSKIKKVIVSVKKPEAITFVDSAEVEIERRQRTKPVRKS